MLSKKLPLMEKKKGKDNWAFPSLNVADRHASSKEYNPDVAWGLCTEEELARVCTFRKEV